MIRHVMVMMACVDCLVEIALVGHGSGLILSLRRDSARLRAGSIRSTRVRLWRRAHLRLIDLRRLEALEHLHVILLLHVVDCPLEIAGVLSVRMLIVTAMRREQNA